MDIRCPKCGEPWDIDSLHEEVIVRNYTRPWTDPDGTHHQDTYERYFKEVKDDFNKRGCIAVGGDECQDNPRMWGLASIISDVMGDDIDGEAMMWDDAERWGLL